MAQYDIKVTPEEIRALSDKFSNQRSIMENYMNEMNSKITELQNHFRDDAGKQFSEKYTSVSRDISNCLENLQTEITSLRNAAGIFDSGISKTDAAIGNLPASGAFANTD